MIKQAKHIYYRGYLSSCNYTCYYCPFAKKKHSKIEIQKDIQALENFFDFIQKTIFDSDISIFFTPYGEGLVHTYYMDYLVKFARLGKIKYISIQTNLSFDPKLFLSKLQEKEVSLDKIKLWASFHPTMVSAKHFAEKANYLHKYLDISVGMVAIPGTIDKILELKQELDPNVYLWLNAQSRQKNKYSAEDIRVLKHIDPLFEYELNTIRLKSTNTKQILNPSIKLYEKCSASRSSFFLEANGDVLPCHVNKKILYNIYHSQSESSNYKFTCTRKICDCYLAYSNLEKTKLENFFGELLPVRIPFKKDFQAIFLDIDGTLTDSRGNIRSTAAESILNLEKYAPIYLATSLSYEQAHKKCKSIWKNISGGVFSNGAYIIDQISHKTIHHQIQAKEILENPAVIHLSSRHLIIDKIDQQNIIRILLPSSIAHKLPKYNNTQVTSENAKSYIQHHSASKTLGIQQICQWNGYHVDFVLVVGNSQNDLEMLSKYKHSVATTDAPQHIKDIAHYIMDIEHIPYISK
ncbi:Hydroxymethylpyrimidine pyrophosphatase [Anaerovirgula multivorans]|uniref:Hydroxymethylpyrimidine pyrophosphatase n=1 Tax=Anaerovirgula multivorans TaxID=312168 RepID=A0A239L4Y4_9FIRM|nr:STM4011 family radical SAM protein [Anaerovirgula multivorans]SNT24883.1 Hydroxymethylpyrimidine pyrophosphatase [Anaerovirgula multivorans]